MCLDSNRRCTVATYQQAPKIVQARIGIVSSNEERITEPRYLEGQILGSLLTNIHSIESIPYREDLEVEIKRGIY